jgi:hypothetical protein
MFANLLREIPQFFAGLSYERIFNVYESTQRDPAAFLRD